MNRSYFLNDSYADPIADWKPDIRDDSNNHSIILLLLIAILTILKIMGRIMRNNEKLVSIIMGRNSL